MEHVNSWHLCSTDLIGKSIQYLLILMVIRKNLNKGFCRTKPSTLKMIRDSATGNKRLVKILREIENEHGGIMGAHSSCDLPRDRRQIYNMKQKVTSVKSISSSSVARNDTLACNARTHLQPQKLSRGCS